MLLTHLHETIAKRAATAEDLQKILDVAECVGVIPTGAKTVKLADNFRISGLITAGTLPFTVEACEPAVGTIELGTITSLKGLEKVTVGKFAINRYLKPSRSYNAAETRSKLRSVEHCPLVTDQLEINSCIELTSLKGLRLGEGATLKLSELHKLTSLEGAENAREIMISGCNSVSLKNFPKSCTRLDIEYNKIKRGMPWFVLIPSTCTIKSSYDYTFGNDVPRELYVKMCKLQESGSATRRDMLEIQQDLIEAGLDELAEI